MGLDATPPHLFLHWVTFNLGEYLRRKSNLPLGNPLGVQASWKVCFLLKLLETHLALYGERATLQISKFAYTEPLYWCNISDATQVYYRTTKPTCSMTRYHGDCLCNWWNCLLTACDQPANNAFGISLAKAILPMLGLEEDTSKIRLSPYQIGPPRFFHIIVSYTKTFHELILRGTNIGFMKCKACIRKPVEIMLGLTPKRTSCESKWHAVPFACTIETMV